MFLRVVRIKSASWFLVYLNFGSSVLLNLNIKGRKEQLVFLHILSSELDFVHQHLIICNMSARCPCSNKHTNYIYWWHK